MSADVSKRTPGQMWAGGISDLSGWMGLYAGDREQSVGYLTPLRNGTPDERGDVETLANAAYMVEAWNNYDRVLRERDALAEAAQALISAEAMSEYGPPIDIEPRSSTYNSDWGGGDCTKHGRWYGFCHGCREDSAAAGREGDRIASRRRDDAIRAAAITLRTALASLERGVLA